MPAEVLVDTPLPDRRIDVQMSRGQMLSGELLSRSGAPVAGLRITAVGVGYGRRDPSRSPPLCRAYPGSGWGAATTDDEGRFEIAGVGTEPCALYLEDGWHFVELPDSEYFLSARHPVAVPGRRHTFHVVREGYFAFRALDRKSRIPVNAYLEEMLLPPAVRVYSAPSSRSLRAFGLRRHFTGTSYHGKGVNAFPVTIETETESVEGMVKLVGYEKARCTGAIVVDPVSAESSVPEFLVDRSDSTVLGSVSFIVPEDFPADDFPGLPFFVRFMAGGADSSRSYYADREDGHRYSTRIPVGDYLELGIGTTRQARSGPFSVGLRDGPVLVLGLRETRFLQLNVEVRDASGRPLRGCGVTFGEDVGKRELVSIAGFGFGQTDQWPLEVLAPRKILDRTGAKFLLAVFKAGFETASVRVVLQPQDLRQFVAITLERESRQWTSERR